MQENICIIRITLSLLDIGPQEYPKYQLIFKHERNTTATNLRCSKHNLFTVCWIRCEREGAMRANNILLHDQPYRPREVVSRIFVFFI